MGKKNKTLMIDPRWCKGCGICVALCPMKALELVGEKVALKQDGNCVLCGTCELHCPDYAVWIKEEKEEA
ncbi:MAG: 4Fe-4S binding protein [Eubacterium sp.]|nr:4Fe-4S binding protein [Eubacterium sp.]